MHTYPAILPGIIILAFYRHRFAGTLSVPYQLRMPGPIQGRSHDRRPLAASDAALVVTGQLSCVCSPKTRFPDLCRSIDARPTHSGDAAMSADTNELAIRMPALMDCDVAGRACRAHAGVAGEVSCETGAMLRVMSNVALSSLAARLHDDRERLAFRTHNHWTQRAFEECVCVGNSNADISALLIVASSGMILWLRSVAPDTDWQH